MAADGEATGGARPWPNADCYGATEALRLGGDGAAAAAHRLHDGGVLDVAADGGAAGDASGLPHGDFGDSADARRRGAVSDDVAANLDSGARGGRADGELPGALGATQRSRVPIPFFRKLWLHMDSCPGTNTSQFFLGGLGMLLACGVADCAQVLYMVVGHTKFGPDLVARSLAGVFNRSDMYSHGQLVHLFRAYATAGAYNRRSCVHGSRAPQRFSRPFITSYPTDASLSWPTTYMWTSKAPSPPPGPSFRRSLPLNHYFWTMSS